MEITKVITPDQHYPPPMSLMHATTRSVSLEQAPWGAPSLSFSQKRVSMCPLLIHHEQVSTRSRRTRRPLDYRNESTSARTTIPSVKDLAPPRSLSSAYRMAVLVIVSSPNSNHVSQKAISSLTLRTKTTNAHKPDKRFFVLLVLHISDSASQVVVLELDMAHRLCLVVRNGLLSKFFPFSLGSRPRMIKVVPV